MKRIATKLTSRKGETLVEILVAVLIVGLAAGMFAALYSASMKINTTAREEDEAFYKAVGDLENIIESDDKGTATDGTLHYVPMVGEGTEKHEDTANKQYVKVDVVTQDGLSVYKSKGTSGAAGGSEGGGE